MARKENFLIGILSDIIRGYPKTSITIAFNLGVYAALATRKHLIGPRGRNLPARLVELVPAMKDLGEHVPPLALRGEPPRRTPKAPPKRRAV